MKTKRVAYICEMNEGEKTCKELAAENSKLKELIQWLRDGLDHFTGDEEAWEQSRHLANRIDEVMK